MGVKKVKGAGLSGFSQEKERERVREIERGWDGCSHKNRVVEPWYLH